METLVTLDTRLAEDTEFLKASTAFWGAPAAAPAFVRVESSLMSAFAGWPKLVAPKSEKRVFQLRTYESPSYAGHVRKVQMFNEAEIAIFTRTGLTPVFFGDTLIGHRTPSPVSYTHLVESFGERATISHISRKNREIWGTRVRGLERSQRYETTWV